MKRKQTDRVKKALDYVKRKLRLDMEFVVIPAEPGESSGVMEIERSDRGTEDRKAWVITFDVNYVTHETAYAQRRHAFHEVLHALTWPLFDEVEAAIRRVPDTAVKRELMARSLDARENVVYELERKLGPLAFPMLPWGEP